MSKHIISTLSADTDYASFVTQPGVSTVLKKVRVRGGAGVATGTAGQRIITPGGVRTEVSDEDAAFLANHKQFKDHQDRGHVRIEAVARDPDKVAGKMEPDKSVAGANSGGGGGPKTPADVKKDADDAAKKGVLQPGESLQAVTNKGK